MSNQVEIITIETTKEIEEIADVLLESSEELMKRYNESSYEIYKENNSRLIEIIDSEFGKLSCDTLSAFRIEFEQRIEEKITKAWNNFINVDYNDISHQQLFLIKTSEGLKYILGHII